MNRIFLGIAISIFVVFAIIVSIDIFYVQKEISNNSVIINSLAEQNRNNEKAIKELEVKIERMKSSPKTAESVLTDKYKMLRKDQYIINDKAN